MKNKNNFELINSGYKPPLIQKISGLQSVAGFKPPLIVFNFELIILNFEFPEGVDDSTNNDQNPEDCTETRNMS